MAIILRVTGAYLILVGAAVAVHFLANQFYDPLIEGDSLTVWRILDPLMVIGLAAVVVCAWTRKRRADAGAGVGPGVSGGQRRLLLLGRAADRAPLELVRRRVVGAPQRQRARVDLHRLDAPRPLRGDRPPPPPRVGKPPS